MNKHPFFNSVASLTSLFFLAVFPVTITAAYGDGTVSPSVLLDTDISSYGCQSDSVITGIESGGSFGFGVYARNLTDVTAAAITLRWDASLAHIRPNFSGPGIPADIVSVNGRANLTLAEERNLFYGNSNGVATVIEDGVPGVFSLTVAPQGVKKLYSGDGLLCFAAFYTGDGFDRADSLIVEVSVDFLENGVITAPCLTRTLIVRAIPPSLTLLYPRAGETIIAGHACRILWKSTGVDSIAVEYSPDGGQSWNIAAGNVYAPDGSFLWSLPAAAANDCMIRIHDNDGHGLEDSTEGCFRAVKPPVIRLSVLKGASPEFVPIRYHIDDPGKRTVRLACKYARSGYGDWQDAATDKNLSLIDADRYSGTFFWKAKQDCDSYTGEIRFMVTSASDFDENSAEVSIFVDFNDHPGLIADPVAGQLSGNIPLAFSIRDREGDTVSLKVSYSSDGGETWREAAVIGETTGLKPERYSGTLTWISRADLPDELCSGSLLRMTAYDSGAGETVTLGPFTLDNRIIRRNGTADGEHSAGIPVLAFHNVELNKYDNAKFSITPVMFERIVTELKNEGYTFLSTPEYVDYITDGCSVPEKSVLLMFDDGYRPLFTRLLPLLKEYDVKAGVNIICSQTGSFNYLTADQIRIMHGSGLVDFQSHSFNLHFMKTDIPEIFRQPHELEILYKSRVMGDMTASIDMIEDVTGVSPVAFIAPYGYGDETVESFAREAGFRSFFYIGEDVMNSYGDNPYHLERITVMRRNAKIIAKLLVNEVFPQKKAGSAKSVSVSTANLPNGVTVKFACHIPGGIIASSPAVGCDGTIYIGSWDGCLYAVDRQGVIRWSFQTGDAITSSPAVGPDGTIYIGSYDRHLYAVNPDGSMKWRYDCWDAVYSSPAVDSGGSVYTGATDGGFLAVNENGTSKWNYRTGDSVLSSPAIGSDGSIYVGSWSNHFLKIDSDRVVQWEFRPGSGFESSPAVGCDGTVYVGGMDGFLYALSPGKKLLWKFPVGGWVDSSPVIGHNETVYIGGRDGYLYAIDPDGAERWRFRTGDRVETSPAVGEDGAIYFGSWDGYLYALNPDGNERWRFQTGGGIDSSPVISPEGILYAASSDSYLYGIDTGTGAGLAASSWPCFRGNEYGTGVRHDIIGSGKPVKVSDGKESHSHPRSFNLDDPFPNPSNASVSFRFSVPHESNITMAVYSVSGQHICDLADSRFAAGHHTVTWDAADMPSGVYFVRLRTVGFSAVKKLTLLK